VSNRKWDIYKANGPEYLVQTSASETLGLAEADRELNETSPARADVDETEEVE
jgi:hypothetical protein